MDHKQKLWRNITRIIEKYLAIYLYSLYGSVSDFKEEIEKEKISNTDVDIMITKTDKHLLITFIAETKKVNKITFFI